MPRERRAVKPPEDCNPDNMDSNTYCGGDESGSGSSCCTSSLNSKRRLDTWWGGLKVILGRKEVCALVNVSGCASILLDKIPFPYCVLAEATLAIEKARVKAGIGCYGTELLLWPTGTLYKAKPVGSSCNICGNLSVLQGACVALAFIWN